MLLERQFNLLVGLALLLLLPAAWVANAAPDPAAAGRKIYLKQCARCHGREGQGVSGKFDGPLQGNRTLEKLTRYINRTMPDDDPGTCTGPQAEAVSRYIYDAFYSLEARLRKNPARVELVRLTNRQYLNTIADLMQQSTGPGEPVGPERGLRGNYYRSRNTDSKNQVLERMDRGIDFDFAAAWPDEKMSGTNGCAVDWRGGLIADETGDYEIVVNTPNGMRLHLNDDDEPLIDATVSNAKLTEHRATIRLLGGRVYPLRLHFFKTAEKSASVSLCWKPPRGAMEVIPARNLTPARPKATFVINTPFPPDDSSVGYERGVLVSKAWDEATTQGAIQAANYLAMNLDRFANTKPDATNRVAKVQTFCADFVAAAFRRPLSSEELKLHVTDQFTRAKTTDDAVKRVALLALKSPQFLYLGLRAGPPDDYEIATRLSFALWDSLPNKELKQAAAKGGLRTQEQISAQAQRMLRDPRAHSKALTFLHHWLQMDRVEPIPKDDKVFPGFTPAIIGDLHTSLDLFLEETFWSESSDYRQLLSADYIYMNQRLAAFYGLSTNATDDFIRVKPDDGQRSGVLTHPYLLATFAYQKQTSPIHRGVFITRNIVGRTLKPPPMAVAFKDAEFDPHLTMRQKISELTRPQNCQTCHSVINPLGFSLEHFDAVGRFRASEQDRPIDTASDYVTDDGETVHLTGAPDIAQFALASETAQRGFIEQMFHQVVKQPMLAYGPEVMNRLRQSFVASGFNLQKLLVDIAVTSAAHGLPSTAPAPRKS